MDLSYYPGCSLHGTASEYSESTVEVCSRIGVELREVEDWNCCGASSAHSVNHDLGLALSARNLVLAEARQSDLVVPCAACFNRLKAVELAIQTDDKAADDIERTVGASYRGGIEILHLLDLLASSEVKDSLRKAVSKPLKGLKPACYYGCLITRPPKVTRAEDIENPTSMDELMSISGADPVKWAYKTDCCGGGHALARTDIVAKLVKDIVDGAEEAGADCIVSACPMCQANIDMRQEKDNGSAMPVFFMTELLGLALELESAREWFGRHIIDPVPLLEKAGLV